MYKNLSCIFTDFKKMRAFICIFNVYVYVNEFMFERTYFPGGSIKILSIFSDLMFKLKYLEKISFKQARQDLGSNARNLFFFWRLISKSKKELIYFNLLIKHYQYLLVLTLTPTKVNKRKIKCKLY